MRRAALLALALLGLLACSPREDDPPAVRIWSGWEAELPVLRDLLQEFTQVTGLPARLLHVPFGQLRNKFLIAAPAGLGPDLLLGPQDWIGVLATAGLLSAIPDDLAPRSPPRGDYLPVAVEGVTFDQQIYGVPLFTECLALIRNPTLLPDQPATLAALIQAGQDLQGRRPDLRPLYFDPEDFYVSWAFFAGHGAYLFGQRGGDTDPFDVGLDTPAAIEAATFLRRLRQDLAFIPSGATADLAKSLFLEGRAAAILGGPWLLKDLQARGVPYRIDPFPLTASGGRPRPFVGTQGIMLSRHTRQPASARRLLEHLSTEDSASRLALASGRPPARRGALRRASAESPDIEAFAAIAEQGTPLPTHPAMGAVWAPMQRALQLITDRPGGTEAEIARHLQGACRSIEDKARLMLE